jgi:hypothetical protein
MKSILALLAFGPAMAGSILAAPIMPTADGTTWSYWMTEEAGEGLRIVGLPAEEKIRLPVAYRIDGTQKVDENDLLKFEMHRAGVVTNTDLLKVDDHRIICFARIDAGGALAKLSSPQIIVPPQSEEGASWDYEAEIDGAKATVHFTITGQEDVDVPAGKFHAFKIHSEQTEPTPITEDRWFANGIGIVKDITTTRNPDGKLVHRVTLELKERPKIGPRPEVKPTKKLSATISKDAVGPAVARIGGDAEKIYARWQGNGLRKDAKVRVVWIAEDIGDAAPPDYTIDEAVTTAPAADARGSFMLSRPEGGWVTGSYRAEFYLDDALADTVKLKIEKSGLSFDDKFF